MFRLFLTKKTKDGKTDSSVGPTSSTARKNARQVIEKRTFTRFPVEDRHLALLNDQDILLIRDISTQGLCSEVSTRAFRRFTIGDTYNGRIKYREELHDLSIKVAWKARSFIGFEIVKTDKKTGSFLKRLIEPMETAASLEEIKEESSIENNVKKSCYRGIHNTELLTWTTPSDENLLSWKFSQPDFLAMWNEADGFNLEGPSGKKISKKDEAAVYQVVIDIFMAFHAPVRDMILESINIQKEVYHGTSNS